MREIWHHYTVYTYLKITSEYCVNFMTVNLQPGWNRYDSMKDINYQNLLVSTKEIKSFPQNSRPRCFISEFNQAFSKEMIQI